MSQPKDNSSSVAARHYVDVRATRRVRLIDHGGRVTAYPEPHRTPVLPAGWAPLTREQQEAVLQACDAAPQCVVFRIGSLWEPETEYRVYRLTDQHWAGLWVASRYCAMVDDDPATPENRQLLGLGVDAAHVVQLTIDFFNWDLEAHGEGWRLRATPPPQPVDTDPRR